MYFFQNYLKIILKLSKIQHIFFELNILSMFILQVLYESSCLIRII